VLVVIVVLWWCFKRVEWRFGGILIDWLGAGLFSNLKSIRKASRPLVHLIKAFLLSLT